MTRIAALLACFNRKRLTLRTLESVFAQQSPDAVVDVFLVDDASTDGTAQAVAERFPQVNLIGGTGSLFWNRGMIRAWAAAFQGDYDFYLWVNDDTHLDADALPRLLQVARELARQGHAKTIVAGSTRDTASGKLTYGGVVRSSRLHPIKYRVVQPSDRVQPCDTMNGNCVLISCAAAQRAGNLSAEFTHSIGDFDYGLRARAAGCSVWVAPGFHGTCSHNAVAGTWLDRSLPLARRWASLTGPKEGLPVREWRTFCRRHAGAFWPLFWVMPYTRVVLTSIFPVNERRPAAVAPRRSLPACKRAYLRLIRRPLPLSYVSASVDAGRVRIVRDVIRRRKRVFVNVNIDDVAPFCAREGGVDMGGELDAGFTLELNRLLDDFPALRLTLFVIPDLRIGRRSFSSQPRACITDEKNSAWIQHYRGLSQQGRVEIALHGLHHRQTENRLFSQHIEFAFKDRHQAQEAIKKGMELFRRAGLPITGFRAPGWGMNGDLSILDAIRESSLAYIAGSSLDGGLNEQRQLVSNYYPTVIRGVLNLPQNVLLEQSKAELLLQVERIARAGGIISIKGHTPGAGTANDLTTPIIQKLRWLLTTIGDRYGDAVE